jgi:hypothetical protein
MTMKNFVTRIELRRKWTIVACVALFLTLGGLSEDGFAQNKKGKGGSPFNSFPKTSGGASKKAKHGHVGAQSSKGRGGATRNGGNASRNHPSKGRGNHASHNHHRGHSNHSRPVYPRSFGNVYGNVYGGGFNQGFNPYRNRYGSGIGFSTSLYSPGFVSPGYSRYSTYYGLPYGYGGYQSNYNQPNFTQPFGYSPSNYQHGYQLQVQPNYNNTNNNYSNSQIELLRLQLELQRLRELEAAQRNAQQVQAQPAQVQFQPEAQQPDLMPPANPVEPNPDNQAAIDELNLAPIIDGGQAAGTSQHRAEKAFREGRYGQAAQFADLAVSLNEENGMLKLFASQAHFSNGNYSDAASALESAGQSIDPQQWSYIVDNFRLFYGKNDFVSQTRALSDHLARNPNDVNALMVRGFQFGALGYPEAANKDFDRALSLDANRQFINRLKARFGDIEVERPVQ